jgi:hypothetical protein
LKQFFITRDEYIAGQHHRVFNMGACGSLCQDKIPDALLGLSNGLLFPGFSGPAGVKRKISSRRIDNADGSDSHIRSEQARRSQGETGLQAAVDHY